MAMYLNHGPISPWIFGFFLLQMLLILQNFELGTLAENPTRQCKSIPARRSSKQAKLPLSSLLSNGIIEMNSEISRDPRRVAKKSRAIFLLGNTGSGKTTVAQILAGNLHQLHATQDKGNLIIIDDNNKIGVETTQSKTLIPKYVVHPETGTAFWDTTGFLDSREPEIDIASTYFTKHALDKTSSAKFLFLAPHSVVKFPNDTREFDMLVTKAVLLFTNVTKFKEAIGLVVTKVGGPGYSNQTEKQISNGIRNFLESYIGAETKKLEGATGNSQKRKDQSKINLAQGILGQRRSQAKFGFVRRPEYCGPLGEMAWAQDARKKLTDMYTKNLRYISIQAKDIRFTLKPESVNEVEAVSIPKTTKEIKRQVSQIKGKMEADFQDKLLNKLDTSLEDGIKYLKNITTTIKRTNTDSSRKPISQQLELFHSKLGLQTGCARFIPLEELERQLKFYKMVTNQTGKNEVDPSLTRPLETFSGVIRDLHKFYEFCLETETKLKEYWNQDKLSKLVKQNNGQLKLDNSNVLSLLQDNVLVDIPQNIQSILPKIGAEHKKFLVNLVQQLIPRIEKKCVKSSADPAKYNIIVKGRILTLKDDLSKNSWPTDCKDNFIDELTVIAKEILYIDRNFNLQGWLTQFSIIAPTWIVGLNGTNASVSFNLNGQNAKDHDPQKAASATETGRNGNNGFNGYNGGNAGWFIGIYSQIQNAHLLSISANGGNGGRGQDGGDGKDGSDGSDATFEKFKERGKDQPFCGGGDIGTVLGNSGQGGGHGGHGGFSGPPGHPGTIQIINLISNTTSPDISHSITTSINNGTVGGVGLGGRGATGGRNGRMKICKCHRAVSVSWGNEPARVVYDEDDCHHKTPGEYFQRAPNGTPGNNGGPPSYIPTKSLSPSKWRLINEYKAAFFGNSSTMNFINELDSRPEIRKLLQTMSFAEEAEAIGEKFFKTTALEGSKKQAEFISYYQQFLTRLTEHVQSSLAQNKLSMQDKIALNSIYAAVLGQLIGLRRNENTLNVIDTEGYFTALAGQLETLQTAQKEKVIRDESDKFRGRLDGKAREAMGLIQNTVLPAIEDAETGLQRMNDKLLQELNAFLKAAEKDVAKKKNMTSKFEKVMGIKKLMGVLNVLGSACAFLGPVGAAVGTTISVGTNIAGSLVTAPDSSSFPATKGIKVSTTLTNRLGDVQKPYYQKKIGEIEKQLNLTLEAVEEVANEEEDENKGLNGLVEFVNGVKSSLESFKESVEENGGREADPVKAISLENEIDKKVNKLKEEITKKEGHGKGEDKGGKTKAELKSEKIAANLNTAIKTVEAVSSFVQTSIKDGGELQKMKEMVKEAEKNVKNVEKKKDQFFNELLPALEAIQQDIKRESSALPGQSQVGLSVKKWKVKGMLKSMRWYVQQFTKEFQVAEEFQVCFDTLDEALTLLIDLYDHIERYEEKKQFADFIANVNSASGSTSQITDPNLRRVLENLNYLMQGNLFLERYQMAMHAFKQWVFPFASQYLGDGSQQGIVSGLTPTGMQEMVDMYKRQVQRLRTEMATYKATTDKGDVATIVNTFTGDVVSSKPFYVWDNEQWQGSIKKLLSGQIVELKADVDMISQDLVTQRFFSGKSAIKYKVVEITMKVKDEDRQKELDETLKHFQMIMTHSGISLYKVMGEHYVMRDKNQTYRYSFERTNDGHVSKNGVKYKVEGINADFLMSPYTWWTFQLIDATAGSGHEFVDLEEFGEEIDLQLEGHGIYLDEKRANLNNLNLADHYELYDPETSGEKNYRLEQCVV